MENILFDLYYGNIRPSEGRFLKHRTYKQSAQEVLDLETELLSTLNPDETELYRQLTFAIAKRDSMDMAALFVDGFILGANIMLACLYESGEEE